jgi:membrane protein implicated in regulation of membrane protease activity
MNYDAIAFWSQIAGFVLFALALVWAWNKFLTPALATSAKASNERVALAERHREEMHAAVESLRRDPGRGQRRGRPFRAQCRG